jgi:hypothetical protein
MSERRTAAGAAHRVGSGTNRLARAWRALPHESRLAAFASGALFLALFLPWYQVTLIDQAKTTKLQSASATITGWGAFSFVEAAVLLVAAGVPILLFRRAEGRAFHLPGGDGGVITAAGVWACVLIVWRIFDKQGATTNGPSATTSGIEWGIFVALAAAAFLTYSGSRIRAAHRPEPALPGEESPPAGSSAAATTEVLAGTAPTAPTAPTPARRRARHPTPVPADPPPRTTDPGPSSGDPSRERRPRRHVRAAELFEHVVPEDPPTMPFGRAKRSDVDITIRRPAKPPADDEQPTMAFREDETLPLGEDVTVPLPDDATVPLGRDDTLPLDR